MIIQLLESYKITYEMRQVSISSEQTRVRGLTVHTTAFNRVYLYTSVPLVALVAIERGKCGIVKIHNYVASHI